MVVKVISKHLGPLVEKGYPKYKGFRNRKQFSNPILVCYNGKEKQNGGLKALNVFQAYDYGLL